MLKKFVPQSSSSNTIPVANFFWDGPDISLWSKACILSFQSNGFDVVVYSYSGTLKDACSGIGVSVVDAELICAKSFRDKLFGAAKADTYGKTYACFADFFRLRLLSERPGTWWFDTDVFCLSHAQRFKRLEGASETKVICGYETPVDEPTQTACNAILWFGDGAFAKNIFSDLLETYPPFEESAWHWGQTAIPFLNKVIQTQPEKFNIQPREVFYPLSWRLEEMSIFLLPEKYDEARERCRGSLTLHFWNEIVNRLELSPNRLPPKGSLLYELVVISSDATASDGTLDVNEIRAKLRGSVPPMLGTQRKPLDHQS